MKKRILGILLSLILIVGLLPTAALAEESTLNEDKLSDNTQITSENDITRAQLAEMVYEHESLKTDIDSMGYGGTEPQFNDITDCTEDQKAAITALYKAKIISGTAENAFSPQGTVTRGEFAVVLWRATGSRSNKTAMEGSFTDKLEPWYAPAVNCFYGAGLVNGTASGEFKGGDNISVIGVNTFLTAYANNKDTFIAKTDSGSTTRAEMTVEFYEKFQPQLSKLAATQTWEDPFVDLAGCTESQVEAIKFFYERGIISGTTETTFHPHTPVSNFQIATLLQRCATKEIIAETPAAFSLFSVTPLAEQTPFDFLAAQGLDVDDEQNNPNAPALAETLTTWRDGLVPATPTFTPESGSTFENSQTVTISAADGDESATIYYTINGSEPTTNNTQYNEAITISNTTTVKAITVKNNLISEIATATYTKQAQEPEQPVLFLSSSPASLNGGGMVTLTTNKSVDVITCSDSSITVTGNDTTWTASLPNTTATYTFTAVISGNSEDEQLETAACTVSVTYKSSSSSSIGSNTTTTTEKNPDGSITTTKTDKNTGTVTETTKYTDGSSITVETKKDGTITTTEKAADGSTYKTVENADGSSKTTTQQADGTKASSSTNAEGKTDAEVSLSDKAVSAAQTDGKAVSLPIPPVSASKNSEAAPVVDVTIPSTSSGNVKVEIPVENATPGTVAVIVSEDGTETVVKKSVAVEEGVSLTLDGSATVKIVDNAKDFIDIPATSWISDAVDYVSAREIFNGTSASTFSPNGSMTRGMLAKVLHNLEDGPVVDYAMGFEDVNPNAYYGEAVRWAASKGIVDGYSDDTFGPEDSINREQLAVMLWRYAGTPTSNYNLDRFIDADEISGYALEAMLWATENGIISGTTSTTISPKDTATRAQVAAMLMRFAQAQ